MKTAFLASLVLGNLLFPTETDPETLTFPIIGISPSDVINQYESPLSAYGAGHRGIDLPVELGTEVISPASGKVFFVGQVGYRNTITIEFGSSMKATIEPVCSELSVGSFVAMGDPIGTVCEPEPYYKWHCEITCLHFGTRTALGYFSPLAIIGGLPTSRLVPLGT